MSAERGGLLRHCTKDSHSIIHIMVSHKRKTRSNSPSQFTKCGYKHTILFEINNVVWDQSATTRNCFCYQMKETSKMFMPRNCYFISGMKVLRFQQGQTFFKENFRAFKICREIILFGGGLWSYKINGVLRVFFGSLSHPGKHSLSAPWKIRQTHSSFQESIQRIGSPFFTALFCIALNRSDLCGAFRERLNHWVQLRGRSWDLYTMTWLLPLKRGRKNWECVSIHQLWNYCKRLTQMCTQTLHVKG